MNTKFICWIMCLAIFIVSFCANNKAQDYYASSSEDILSTTGDYAFQVDVSKIKNSDKEFERTIHEMFPGSYDIGEGEGGNIDYELRNAYESKKDLLEKGTPYSPHFKMWMEDHIVEGQLFDTGTDGVFALIRGFDDNGNYGEYYAVQSSFVYIVGDESMACKGLPSNDYKIAKCSCNKTYVVQEFKTRSDCNESISTLFVAWLHDCCDIEAIPPSLCKDKNAKVIVINR